MENLKESVENVNLQLTTDELNIIDTAVEGYMEQDVMKHTTWKTRQDLYVKIKQLIKTVKEKLNEKITA